MLHAYIYIYIYIYWFEHYLIQRWMTQSHPSRWNVVQLNKYLCGIFSFSFEFEWIQSRWRREEEEEGERKRFNVPVAAGWCRVSWRSGRNRCGRSHPVDCVWRNGQSWTGQSRPNCAWPSRNPVPLVSRTAWPFRTIRPGADPVLDLASGNPWGHFLQIDAKIIPLSSHRSWFISRM